MRIIVCIVAAVLAAAIALGISYAIYSCFGMTASIAYMAATLISVLWGAYEMRHASISEE